jgi:prolipoprotein diacylglyceryl transferase
VSSLVLLASFPSPPSELLKLGPLTVRYYGLMIGLGVVVALFLARRRLEGMHEDPDQISDLALWVVPAGLIGTRIYHVATDWNRLYSDGRWWPEAFKIWNGGLGIPGGIAAGLLVGILVCRAKKLKLPVIMDAVAPAIPIAQAIGRIGNYFNQELFGRPTNLPWGVRITKGSELFDVHQTYPGATVFHPTFLYEGLWNVGLAGALIWLDSRNLVKRGKLFPLYVAGYFLGRSWVEELRIDNAARIFGHLRWNFVQSLALVVVGLIWFFWGGWRASPEEIEGRLAEAGPEIDGPAVEGSIAEADESDAPVEVDPEQRS